MTPTPEAVNEPLESSVEELKNLERLTHRGMWWVRLDRAEEIVIQARLSLLTELQAYADKHEMEEVRQAVEVFRGNK